MPQSCLNILHIRPTFNQHGCVGVSQGMIIKTNLQFMVDYPGSILEGKDGVLTKDLEFDSPSGAANFVTKRSTNGNIAWVNKEGVAVGAFRILDK